MKLHSHVHNVVELENIQYRRHRVEREGHHKVYQAVTEQQVPEARPHTGIAEPVERNAGQHQNGEINRHRYDE